MNEEEEEPRKEKQAQLSMTSKAETSFWSFPLMPALRFSLRQLPPQHMRSQYSIGHNLNCSDQLVLQARRAELQMYCLRQSKLQCIVACIL